MLKNKLFLISAGTGTVLLIAAALFYVTQKGSAQEFKTEAVTKGDIQKTVTATGNVNAVKTVLVGTQVSGTIKTLFVDYNSRVKKGQLIAQIDPSTFESQVQQAQANLLAAQANQEKSEASLVDAQRTFDRNRELFSKNLIPRSDQDSAETNYHTSKAQVNVSKAQVEQARAALAVSRQNLDNTKIVSPVNGVVISRAVDVGQTVAASFQTPTLFTIAEDLTKMQIDTNVAESDIGGVKVGQDVEFTVDAHPETTFKGKVWQIRQAPITVQNVVTYNVVVQVGNQDLKLMPGMTANVSIILSISHGVLRIPNAALRFRFSEKTVASKGAVEKKGPVVWVLENKKPKRVSIVPGVSDGMFTEVASGELKVGQQVIVEQLKNNKSSSQTRPPRIF